MRYPEQYQYYCWFARNKVNEPELQRLLIVMADHMFIPTAPLNAKCAMGWKRCARITAFLSGLTLASQAAGL